MGWSVNKGVFMDWSRGGHRMGCRLGGYMDQLRGSYRMGCGWTGCGVIMG